MNILIVHNYYQIPGGEDTVVANEKKMLESHGHKVSFYNRSNSELNQMSLFRKLALPITTVFNPHTYMEIRDIIRGQKIEIVHVHNTLNLVSPSVYYAALSRKVPVVQTIHNFRMICPGATFYRDGHICEDCAEKGKEVDELMKIFSSFISDKISDFQTDVYYQNPSYLECSYREGYLLD